MDALARAGWNLVFLGLDANVFVFTWPSIGTPTGLPMAFNDYQHDRTNAAASGLAIARTIRRLHDFVDKLAARAAMPTRAFTCSATAWAITCCATGCRR